jgi:hypothetical protein
VPAGALAGTVLERADRAAIRAEPFPHIVIENALDAGLYARLDAARPRFADIGWPNPTHSNLRVAYGARHMLDQRRFGDTWASFIAAHVEPAVTWAVAALFRDHWSAHLPDAGWLAAARYGLLDRDGFDAADVLLDARVEIMTPVTQVASAHRRGHVDAPNRLFSGLFYMRADEDDSVGGGLELFRWTRERAARLDVNELDPRLLEPVATVPYAANTLVLFPNSPDALHGAALREPTPHERSYVFITAEVSNDLF